MRITFHIEVPKSNKCQKFPICCLHKDIQEELKKLKFEYNLNFNHDVDLHTNGSFLFIAIIGDNGEWHRMDVEIQH